MKIKLVKLVLVCVALTSACNFSETNETSQYDTYDFVENSGYSLKQTELEGSIFAHAQYLFTDDEGISYIENAEGIRIKRLDTAGKITEEASFHSDHITQIGPYAIENARFYLFNPQKDAIEVFLEGGEWEYSIPLQMETGQKGVISELCVVGEWIYYVDTQNYQLLRVKKNGNESPEVLLTQFDGKIALFGSELYAVNSQMVKDFTNSDVPDGEQETIAEVGESYFHRWNGKSFDKLFKFPGGYTPGHFVVEDNYIVIVSGGWNVVDRFTRQGEYIDTIANFNRAKELSLYHARIFRVPSGYILINRGDNTIITIVNQTERAE